MSFIAVSANAYNFTHHFNEYYGIDTIASARSPQRNSLGNDDFPPVISKLNQPRNSSGENPHTGTDFYMEGNADLYPLFSGYVVANSPDTSPATQSGYIQIKSNIDGVDYYFTYYHIIPDTTLVYNTYVDITDIIGEVQVNCNVNIIPTHVHIACRKDASNGLTTKLFPFYRSVSEYNFGADMDYLCGDHFDANMFYIYAYTKSDRGEYDPYGYAFDCSKVVMYYNLNNSGWTSRQYNTSNYYNSTTRLYQFNLLDLGMECGDMIQIYLAAERNGDSNDSDITFNIDNNNSNSLDYALWPMYYKQPQEVLGTYVQYYEYTLDQTHDWTAWSVTTQPTCTTVGKETRTCINCGAEDTRDYGSPLGHNYNAATCVLPATCTRCGATTGNSLGHNWSGWVYQYTYYDYDWQSNVNVFKRTCSRCGAVEYEYI